MQFLHYVKDILVINEIMTKKISGAYTSTKEKRTPDAHKFQFLHHLENAVIEIFVVVI